MGKRLGEFEELVLMALVRLGDSAYGKTIRQELQERAGRHVSIGALYETLKRMERKSYVSSAMGEPTAKRGGRSKRYFKIRAPGMRALRETRAVRARMAAGTVLDGVAST